MAEESDAAWPNKMSEAWLYEASGAAQLDEESESEAAQLDKASRLARLDGESEVARS